MYYEILNLITEKDEGRIEYEDIDTEDCRIIVHEDGIEIRNN